VSGLEHMSLPDAVRSTLRRRILNAEIPAGARLVETQLAEEFEVSRTTIRQALRDLQAEGLVELAPRRHCTVTRMDADDAADVLYARYTLELGAVREWLANVPTSFDSDLKRELEAMEIAAASNDMQAAVEADTRFHGLLIEAGHRPRLGQLWHTLDGQMGALMRSSIERQHSDLADLAKRHIDLTRTIATRDPELIELALREHYIA
jgi:DNA-binding GntR family transcriptional regulator